MKEYIAKKDLTKNLIILSKTYYESALILNELYTKINYNLIYPMNYMLRHCIELIIKSLIVQESFSDKIDLKTMKINLSSINNDAFYINKTHNLETLYIKYLEVVNNRVSEGFILFDSNQEESSKISQIFADYSKFDKMGDRYRYPVSKSGLLNKIKFASEEKLRNIKFGYLPKKQKKSLFLFDFTELDVKTKIINIIDEKSYYFMNRFFDVATLLAAKSKYMSTFFEVSILKNSKKNLDYLKEMYSK